MRPDFQGPLRLAGVYMLLSALWIFGSDHLVHTLIKDSDWLAVMQTSKGLLFILLSTALIFLFSLRDHRAQRRLLDAITYNSQLLQHTQRNAGLGSWEYRNGFLLSEETQRLLGRDPSSQSYSVEDLLS